ncbi:MAG TPA: c-type cytochrome, partial [Candidatus Acidoferrum sp.]|nr:c-type cytochrome [Candidatus Acidoferrum sp.]
WQFQTGAGMGAPVTVFERNGKEYVLAYSAGSGHEPTPHGDGLWLFSLDGKLDPALPPGANTALGKAAATGAANLVDGKSGYMSICSSCHGEDGKGGHGGGISLANAKTADFVLAILNQGRNKMPALAANLTPEQLRDITAYVTQTLANQF